MSTYRVRITKTVPLTCKKDQYLVVEKDGTPNFTDWCQDATVFTNYGAADIWTEELPAEVEEFNEVDETGAHQDDLNEDES